MPTHALLFVDQVDSTRQLAEIGDDAMVGVRRRLQALLSTAVELHGGRVFGDTGDGLAAVFEDPAAAGAAALEMRARAVDTQHPDADEPAIHIRVGVHHGDVIPNGDGFIGMAVHLTARLCDLAPSDHIAASDAFAEAIAESDEIRVTRFERRVVKGLAEPVTVHVVTAADEALELPAAVVSAGSEPLPSTPWLSDRSGPRSFVGRADLVAALTNVVAASERQIQVALVHGEAGIGKTTLLHHVGCELMARGFLGLIGRADEHQRDAYREVIEALTHVVRTAPDALLVDHALRHGDLIARLIPGLAHRLPSTSTEEAGTDTDRLRLFEAITDLLRSVAAHQPIVVLLEDMQWASQPSLDLLRHLSRSVDLADVTIITSFRTAERTDDLPLTAFLAQLHGEQNAHRFEVGPLEPSDVAALVADAAAQSPADAGRAAPDPEQLRLRTAGSPLFITEMLRSYEQSTGNVRPADGSLEIPDTVQELATLRVDRLGQRHRAVLADAAVLGASFSLIELEALVDDAGDVLDLLEDAERALIVEPNAADPSESFLFHHVVVRDALYESISPARRRRRHEAAADAIIATAGSGIGSRAADVLRHLEAAGGRQSPDLTIAMAEQAATHAASRLSFDDAVRFRGVVVEARREAGPSPELAEALLALASAQTAAGLLDDGRKTFVETAAVAREAGRGDLLCEAAAGYGGKLKENQAFVEIQEPVALIEEALDHAREPSAIRAKLLVALAVWQRQHRPYASRRALVDEALQIARSLDDPRTLATVISDFHRALHGPNVTDLAWEMSDELERLALELSDDDIALQAANLRLIAGFELGYVGEWVQVTQQLDEVANRVGNIEGKRIALLWRGMTNVMQGDLASLRVAFAELDRLIAAYSEPERMIMLGALGMMPQWFRGEAASMYDVAKNFAPPGILTFLAADAGLLDEARGHMDDFGGPAHLDADQNYLFFLDFVAMTRLAVRSNDAALAATLYEIGSRYQRRNARIGLVAFLGAVDHHLGSLATVAGRWDDATHHYQVALAQHERMGARPFLALTGAELANALEASRAAGGTGLTSVAGQRAAARAIADELGLGLVHELL